MRYELEVKKQYYSPKKDFERLSLLQKLLLRFIKPIKFIRHIHHYLTNSLYIAKT